MFEDIVKRWCFCQFVLPVVWVLFGFEWFVVCFEGASYFAVFFSGFCW